MTTTRRGYVRNYSKIKKREQTLMIPAERVELGKLCNWEKAMYPKTRTSCGLYLMFRKKDAPRLT